MLYVWFLDIVKLASYGVDGCFALALLFLMCRQRALFLDLSMLHVRWHHLEHAPHWDRVAYALHRVAFMWLAGWHLGETVYFFAIHTRDLMIVVHHVLTVLIGTWILLFELYGAYSSIPLLFHYLVSASNLFQAVTGPWWGYGSVYPFYVATYCAVVVGGLCVNAQGGFAWLSVRERHEMYFILIVIVVHTANLLEFGFSARLSADVVSVGHVAAGLLGGLIPWLCLSRYTWGSWGAGLAFLPPRFLLATALSSGDSRPLNCRLRPPYDPRTWTHAIAPVPSRLLRAARPLDPVSL